MKIEIRNKYNDSIIYTGEFETLLVAVEEAVKKGADLHGADLHGADLGAAYLRGAYLGGADLGAADLGGADLGAAGKITVDWQSHELLSEILWQASGNLQSRKMLAAFVGRQTAWCWEKWETWKNPQKSWALKELSKWIKGGDGAPDLVKKYTKKVQP